MVSICIRTAANAYSCFSYQFSGNGLRILLVPAAASGDTTRFLIFVPDSPTATFFFLFVLLAFIMKRNAPLFEALALVTLVKYGLWAVAMNFLVLAVTGDLPWEGYMLIASHFAMAVQGVLYSPYFRFSFWHLAIAAVWTLHNDVIDYLFDMMPQYSMLSDYMTDIGYGTFWLSIFSIGLAYFLVVSKKQTKLELM